MTKKALDLLFTAVDHRYDVYLLNHFFVIVSLDPVYFFLLVFFWLLLFLISEIRKAYIVNRRMEDRAKESAVDRWNIKFIFWVTELKTFWLEVWQYLHSFLVFTTGIRFVYISYWFHSWRIMHKNRKPLVKAKTPRTKWYPEWTQAREREDGLQYLFTWPQMAQSV